MVSQQKQGSDKKSATTKTTFTRREAETLAKELRAAGSTYSAIADELTKRGWKSNRGGPVSIGGVASLLGMRPEPIGRAGRARSSKEDSRATVTSLNAVRAILLTPGLSAEDRIATALLVIEAMEK